MRAVARVAALVAVLALAGCVGWASGSDAPRVAIDPVGPPSTTIEAPQPRIAVYKVAAEIPEGTTAEQAIAKGLIVESEVPREFLPATYVRSLASIEGMAATQDLRPNQVLVEDMFGPTA